MNKKLIHKVFLIVVITLTSCSCQKQDVSVIYPKIKAAPISDTIHGVAIEDIYRNLENMKDSKIQLWFRDQATMSDSIMSILKGDNILFKKMEAYENRKTDIIDNLKVIDYNDYFFVKRKHNETIGNLFRKKNGLEELLFSPKSYKENSYINYFKVSPDVSKVLISIADKGSSKSTVVVLDINTQELLPDTVNNVVVSGGGISWNANSKGFFYLTLPHFNYDDPSYFLNAEAKYYKLGTKKSIPILSRKHNNKFSILEADIPIVWVKKRNPNMLFARISGVSKFKDTYYINNQESSISNNLNWKPLFKKEDKIKQFIIVDGYMYYRSAKNASSYKICRVKLGHDLNLSETLVPEKTNEVIVDFEIKEGKLYYTTIENGIKAKFFILDKGIEKEIKLPLVSGTSYVAYWGKDIYLSTNGWTSPSSLFRYLDDGTFENVSIDTTKYNEFEAFIVEEIEVKSHDGESIPLTVIRPRNSKKNGKNRLIINAYGAYGATSSPFFYIPYLTWVEEGGIFAIAHVRGGGEKGDKWHKAGFKTTKSNSWKDVNACTEYLIQTGYTSPGLTIAYGVSAGGISVGRAVVERPDLYSVASYDVPFFNALRSEFQPSGKSNIDEFGTIENASEFKALKEMDVYYNIREEIKYPATYIKTGMKDGTVVPWDPAKVIAKLQNNTATKKPVLLSVDYDEGHGGDGSMKGYYQDMANIYYFALWQTGHPNYQLK